jgi:translocation and assembly module TamB
MRAAARLLAIAVAVPIALVLAGFGLLQTRTGQDWLAGAIVRAVNSPGFSLAIEGLRGIVPLRMTAARIAVGDGKGIWLSLRDVALDLAPGELLSGRLHVRSLDIADVEMPRPASSGSSEPLSQSLRVPHLPVAVVLDRFTISRLTLSPAVLGEKVVATIKGSAAIEDRAARADLDLHRTDGFPGNIALQMTLTGTNQVLDLQMKAADPTGILLDRWLERTDRLPLAVSLDGKGPVAQWHGRLTAAAGAIARLDADITLAVGSRTVLGISGKAALAPLLPADLALAVGSQATYSLRAELGERIVLDRLAIGIAAGTIAGDASFDADGGAIAADLRADLPHLALLSGIIGAPLRGSASLNVGVTGSRNRPLAQADLSAAGIGISGGVAERIEAHASAIPTGPLDGAATRIAVAANGRIEGLALPVMAALPTGVGRGIDWSLAADTDRDVTSVDLTRFSVRGGGIDLTASGHLATPRRTIVGQVDFAGSASGMRTGIAALDALIGDRAVVAGAVHRDAAGVVALDHVALTGGAANLSGNARFAPASHVLAAALTLDVPQLKPLGMALGAAIGGMASARFEAEGPPDRLRLRSELEGRGVTAGGMAIEHFHLSGEVADLSQPKAAIDGSFRAFGLDGSLALAAEPRGNSASELAIPRLQVRSADSTVEGNLRIALATGLVQGALTARIANLSRWSGVTGRPLGGSLELRARLAEAGGGQGVDLAATGTRLAAGADRSRIEIGNLGLSAQLADIWRTPSAAGRLAFGMAHFRGVDIAAAGATFSSPRPGRFAFQGNADGRPLSMTFAGEGGLAPDGAGLRLIRLAGSLGSDQFRLAQPLDMSRRGADLALSGLDLRLGAGRITGGGAVRGEALTVALNAANLSLAAGARLLGYPGVHGAMSATANLSGTLRAPRGHVVLNAQALSFAGSRPAGTPRLGLSVTGDWNGRTVDVQGRVTGLEGDRMNFTGSLPLLLTAAPLGLSVPPQSPLSLRLQGGGDLGRLADLLPLGEDRLSGHFAADVAVGGTVASPAAGGELRLTGARYENFATGAVLTDLSADLVGDRDRFRLASFSAGDGAAGTVTARGDLVLSGASGSTAQLSATFSDFRVAARDEALVTASGTISITGPLSAPRAAAALTVDRAEINLPDSLPPNVVVLHVSEIGERTGKHPPPVEALPVLPAALDITVSLPGPVLVRGHGLDSRWHGRLAITGTTDAPKIAGTLVADRGSVDLLGKSFVLTRGVITFDGGARLDPALDIVAEVSAADITAQVIITGYASAPKITLASTPPVPQDEILSRVLFNQGVGQINAGQGVQLAQAAATLAGGGPGVLDRLRGKLGLDWLRFGQGPAGAASSILNPSVVTPATSSATAVSAGKYVMPGVSVGVTQGISPPTSKVTVEIELGHHVTVDTEAGQNGGTGIGLNYNFDY